MTSNSDVLRAPPGCERGKAPCAKDRLLKAARGLFVEFGLQGTAVREISLRAGVNLASICYYFRSKEALYQAVIQEACRELAIACQDFKPQNPDFSEEDKLRHMISRLMESLSGEQAWIAKLLFWEMVGPTGKDSAFIKAGIDDCFLPLENTVRRLLGEGASLEVARFSTLSIISQCAIFSVVSRHSQHLAPPFNQLEHGREKVAKHVQDFSLWGLQMRKHINPS